MTQIEQAPSGIVTPEMEFVARRESRKPEQVRAEVARGRMVIPANVEHLEAGAGADGDRHQVQVQDQRQHRQLGRHLRHRERAGQAQDGRRSGRRHGDGPLDRRQHRRDPPRDHRRQPGADRHRADLPGDPAGQARRGPHRAGPARHRRAPGAAGGRLHDPARGHPPRLHPADGAPDHRDRLAGRLADGAVDDRAQAGEPDLHAGSTTSATSCGSTT